MPYISADIQVLALLSLGRRSRGGKDLRCIRVEALQILNIATLALCNRRGLMACYALGV
jgi:hypothetical protein